MPLEENIEKLQEYSYKIMELARTSASFKMKFLSNAITFLQLCESQYNLAVDGEYIYYNPLFVINKYKDDATYLDYAFLHMTVHCLFQHLFMRKQVDHKLWNAATDMYAFYIINSANDPKLLHSNTLQLNEEREILAKACAEIKVLTPEHLVVWLDNHPEVMDKIIHHSLFLVDIHDVWYEPSQSQGHKQHSKKKRKKKKNKQQNKNKEEQQSQQDEDASDNQDQDQDQDQDENDQDQDQNQEDKKKKSKKNQDKSDSDDDEDSSDSDEDEEDSDIDDNENEDNSENASEDSDDSDDNSEDSDGEGNDKDGEPDDSEEDSDEGDGEDDEDTEEDTDEDSDGGQGSQTSRRDLEEKWKNMAQRAQTSMETGFSKEEGNALAGLQEVTKENISYEDFLRKFSVLTEQIVLNLDEFDYSFYTYGLQLYGNIPLIEPLEYKDTKRIHDFVIAIDTSGSTQGALVQKFLSKTFNILAEQNSFDSRVCIHIIQCDTRIRKDVKVQDLKDLEEYMRNFQIYGGGGTDFCPVFKYVDEMIEAKEFTDLRGLIYFTDGYGSFPVKPPIYETAFAFIGEDHCPLSAVPDWAITLQLDEDEFKEVLR